MGTGTPVAPGDTITAEKMNLKVETVAEDPQDVETERQLDTVYQNTTGRTLLIETNMDLYTTGGGKTLFANLEESDDGINFKVVNEISLIFWMAVDMDFGLPLTGLIKNGKYYKIRTYKTAPDEVNIVIWRETQV